MTSSSFDVLKSKWTAAGQGQVFKFWETLSADQQHSLLNQLSLVDVDRANKIFKTATTSATSETAAEPAAALDPLPKDAFDDLADSSPEDINKWHDAGLAAIANNEVAVILLAGKYRR